MTLCSTLLAFSLSGLLTFFLYLYQGSQELTSEVYMALFDILKFWFVIFWSFTILIALFRSLKYLFNSCINGFELKLLSCDEKSYIEKIGYGDLVRVWRKWLMLLIWLVSALVILALVYTYIFSSYGGLFEWFDIYTLYAFILISGYLSFILMSSRCKKVKIRPC
ncbi:hypothetical protein [Sulfurimonas denitrificans]|uniref:hypothetical protein n=1 Tax=Sulfurimonas denitrificans TaxID=39766 RepID=UPI001EE1D4FA|nr:hypothetical protein [Sulfurimonas denitrificans]MDD3443069.1 hypothetical protein [Sulfurimonas denitrificans]